MIRGHYSGSFSFLLHRMERKQVVDVILSSTTISEICARLGLKLNGSAYPAFKKFAKDNNIDISHLLGTTLGRQSKLKHSVDDVFVNNVKRRRSQLLRGLLALGVEYVCSTCSLKPFWNGKDLQLHVDHINGDHKDNRRENVRLLCPNCHTQTETWGNKKRPVI